MSGGPSKVIVPTSATGVKASVRARAGAPKVAGAPHHKAPQSGYESAEKKGIGVAAALIRVVGEFFAPLEKQWGAVKEAAEKIADVIEAGVIDPLIAGAVAVYEGVKAAAENEQTGATTSEKGTQKAALGIAPAAAAVVGGVAVVDGCGVVPGIVGVSESTSPLIPLQFLSTWGTVQDGSSPASGGSGVKASAAGNSSAKAGVSLDLTDPGDNAAAAAKAVYGHAIGDASRSAAARAATDDAHTAGDSVFALGGLNLFAGDLGRPVGGGAPTHIATSGSDQDDLPWYLAASGRPRPGESVDIIREAFRRANGEGREAAHPDVAAGSPVTERPGRAALPSYRGGESRGHETGTIASSGDNGPVKDRDALGDVGYGEHAFALPLPVMTSGGAGGTHVSMGPSDGDRIEAALEGGHARRDDAEGGGGGGSQSSQHDDEDPDAYADATDPDIWIG